MFDQRSLITRDTARARVGRFAYLGDTSCSPPSGLDPRSYAPCHQDAVCLEPDQPLTNYCTGRLNGYVRLFTTDGYFDTNPDLSDTTIPDDLKPTLVNILAGRASLPPSLSDWAAFDAKASSLGVGGYVALLKKNATPSSSFLAVFSRGIEALGHGLASLNLSQAVSGGNLALASVTDELDKAVPGSGGVIGDVILNALTPLIPFAPEIAATAQGLAGGTPLGSAIVGGASKAGQGFLTSPVSGVGTTSPETLALDSTSRADLVSSLLQSASDFAATGATALAPLKDSLIRTIAAYQSTDGSLTAKLEAAGAEVLKEFVFAATVACSIATAGTASVFCSIALATAGAALSIDTALQYSSQLQAQGKAAKAAGLAKASALDLEAHELQNEIDQLLKQGASRPSSALLSVGIAVALAALVARAAG